MEELTKLKSDMETPDNTGLLNALRLLNSPGGRTQQFINDVHDSGPDDDEEQGMDWGDMPEDSEGGDWGDLTFPAHSHTSYSFPNSMQATRATSGTSPWSSLDDPSIWAAAVKTEVAKPASTLHSHASPPGLHFQPPPINTSRQVPSRTASMDTNMRPPNLFGQAAITLDTLGSHHSVTSITSNSLVHRSSTEQPSQPTTPTSVASSHPSAIAAAHLQEALRHMPPIAMSKQGPVAQLLGQLLQHLQSAGWDGDAASDSSFGPGSAQVTPRASTVSPHHLVHPSPGTFTPLKSKAIYEDHPAGVMHYDHVHDMLGSPESGRVTPRSPGPEFSPFKPSASLSRRSRPHRLDVSYSPPSSQTRPSSPGPQFSPFKTSRSVRWLHASALARLTQLPQPSSARSSSTASASLRCFMDGEHPRSAHASLRGSTVLTPNNPGPDPLASPLKMHRSIRRVGASSPGPARSPLRASASPRRQSAAALFNSSSRDSFDLNGTGSSSSSGPDAATWHQLSGPTSAPTLTILRNSQESSSGPMSPAKGWSSPSAADLVQGGGQFGRSGRSMSRFGRAESMSSSRHFDALNQSLESDALDSLREEFAEARENDNKQYEETEDPQLYACVDDFVPAPLYVGASPRPSGAHTHGQQGNFLHQLYGTPSPILIPNVSLDVSSSPGPVSTRSLMAAFNHAAAMEAVDKDHWSPKPKHYQSRHPPTLDTFTSSPASTVAYPAAQALQQLLVNDVMDDDDDGMGNEGMNTPDLLSPPRSPTTSSPSHPYAAPFAKDEVEQVSSPVNPRLLPFCSPIGSFRERDNAPLPSPAAGWDPEAYRVMEEKLNMVVGEHLAKHLEMLDKRGSATSQPADASPSARSVQTSSPFAPVLQDDNHQNSGHHHLQPQQTLHHLHPDAVAAESDRPEGAGVGLFIAISDRQDSNEDDRELDWGSIHGSGGSTKAAVQAAAAAAVGRFSVQGADNGNGHLGFEYRQRNSLPGNAVMLPAQAAEPPSLQAWRQQTRQQACTPGRSPARSLRGFFDQALAEQAPSPRPVDGLASRSLQSRFAGANHSSPASTPTPNSNMPAADDSQDSHIDPASAMLPAAQLQPPQPSTQTAASAPQAHTETNAVVDEVNDLWDSALDMDSSISDPAHSVSSPSSGSPVQRLMQPEVMHTPMQAANHGSPDSDVSVLMMPVVPSPPSPALDMFTIPPTPTDRPKTRRGPSFITEGSGLPPPLLQPPSPTGGPPTLSIPSPTTTTPSPSASTRPINSITTSDDAAAAAALATAWTTYDDDGDIGSVGPRALLSPKSFVDRLIVHQEHHIPHQPLTAPQHRSSAPGNMPKSTPSVLPTPPEQGGCHNVTANGNGIEVEGPSRFGSTPAGMPEISKVEMGMPVMQPVPATSMVALAHELDITTATVTTATTANPASMSCSPHKDSENVLVGSTILAETLSILNASAAHKLATGTSVSLNPATSTEPKPTPSPVEAPKHVEPIMTSFVVSPFSVPSIDTRPSHPALAPSHVSSSTHDGDAPDTVAMLVQVDAMRGQLLSLNKLMTHIRVSSQSLSHTLTAVNSKSINSRNSTNTIQYMPSGTADAIHSNNSLADAPSRGAGVAVASQAPQARSQAMGMTQVLSAKLSSQDLGATVQQVLLAQQEQLLAQQLHQRHSIELLQAQLQVTQHLQQIQHLHMINNQLPGLLQDLPPPITSAVPHHPSYSTPPTLVNSNVHVQDSSPSWPNSSPRPATADIAVGHQVECAPGGLQMLLGRYLYGQAEPPTAGSSAGPCRAPGAETVTTPAAATSASQRSSGDGGGARHRSPSPPVGPNRGGVVSGSPRVLRRTLSGTSASSRASQDSNHMPPAAALQPRASSDGGGGRDQRDRAGVSVGAGAGQPTAMQAAVQALNLDMNLRLRIVGGGPGSSDGESPRRTGSESPGRMTSLQYARPATGVAYQRLAQKPMSPDVKSIKASPFQQQQQQIRPAVAHSRNSSTSSSSSNGTGASAKCLAASEPSAQDLASISVGGGSVGPRSSWGKGDREDDGFVPGIEEGMPHELELWQRVHEVKITFRPSVDGASGSAPGDRITFRPSLDGSSVNGSKRNSWDGGSTAATAGNSVSGTSQHGLLLRIRAVGDDSMMPGGMSDDLSDSLASSPMAGTGLEGEPSTPVLSSRGRVGGGVNAPHVVGMERGGLAGHPWEGLGSPAGRVGTSSSGSSSPSSPSGSHFTDKRPRPLVINNHGHGPGVIHLPLSPLRIITNSHTPTSMRQSMNIGYSHDPFSSPSQHRGMVISGLGYGYPISPSVTPTGGRAALLTSPGAMKPPKDFSLKQHLGMVTNMLFGEEDE